MSSFMMAVGSGMIAGAGSWWIFIRPIQQNDHERKRRACGLPPKRELPEDRRTS